MRLIDKDKLMEKLEIAEDCENCKHHHHSIYCGMGSEFVTACEAICEAPEVDIPHWIPCSERLPERSDYYLVTEVLAFDEGEYPDVVCVKLEWYSTINKAWHDIPPVAWMPLPEPYKERSEK